MIFFVCLKRHLNSESECKLEYNSHNFKKKIATKAIGNNFWINSLQIFVNKFLNSLIITTMFLNFLNQFSSWLVKKEKKKREKIEREKKHIKPVEEKATIILQDICWFLKLQDFLIININRKHSGKKQLQTQAISMEDLSYPNRHRNGRKGMM